MPKKIEEKQSDPEQIDQSKINETTFSLPSTYSLITAERLLAKFGVSLPQGSISKQIENPSTFYHALMYLPAKRLNINSHIERCRDIQAFGQQKLIHYLFSGEASKPETEPGQNARGVIEQNRQKMVSLGKEFVSWEEGCIERNQVLTENLQDKVLAWQRTVSEVVNDLINFLYENAIEVEQDFADQSFINFLEFSAKLELSVEQIKNYGCAQPTGIVERTVICLVSDSALADKLTLTSIKNMRAEFKVLDDKLNADYDELNGVNQNGKVAVESDIEFIDELSNKLEEHVIYLSKKLFDYYTEYSSDNSLKVDAGDALELGVDPIVADDYKALQI